MLKDSLVSTWIYLPSTVASRAIRMYMPFSAWRKYAALGSVSTSMLRDTQIGTQGRRKSTVTHWTAAISVQGDA